MAIMSVYIGGFLFDTVDGDEISENIIDGDLEVVVPVYGSMYLRHNNPLSGAHTINTLSLEGPETSFSGLANKVKTGDFSIVSISFDSDTFYDGIVMGVSSQKNLTHNKDVIKGTVKLIKI